jgi:hypothetical protein
MEGDRSKRDEESLKKRVAEMVTKYVPEMGERVKPGREMFSFVSSPLFSRYRFLNDSREGVLGEIDLSDVKREGAEDLLFSDGILEEIEKQRERILEEIGELVGKREECRKEGREGPTIESVLRLLQRAILDLEKIQVEVGMESIEECREILLRLDQVRDGVRKSVLAERRGRRITGILLFLVAPCLLAVCFGRYSDQAGSFFRKMLLS